MIEQQSLREELQTLLGRRFAQFVPDELASVRKEVFRSETFREARFDYMPEVYGQGDRALYTVTFPDGRMAFIATGRISSQNPFEVGHAASGGLDLRRNYTLIYEYDGQGIIIEHCSDKRKPRQYSGKNGNPELLLGFLRPSLGTLVTNPS